MTDSSGNTWTTAYDQLGDKVTSTDPDSGTTTSQFDDAGSVTEITDARHAPFGGVTTTYDTLGKTLPAFPLHWQPTDPLTRPVLSSNSPVAHSAIPDTTATRVSE